MLVPVLLAMCFILPHWWNNENNTSLLNKICTLILVLFQFYPQWKMLQVLYLGLWKKDVKWKEAKENHQRNLGSLGKALNKDHIYFIYYICTPVVTVSRGMDLSEIGDSTSLFGVQFSMPNLAPRSPHCLLVRIDSKNLI